MTEFPWQRGLGVSLAITVCVAFLSAPNAAVAQEEVSLPSRPNQRVTFGELGIPAIRLFELQTASVDAPIPTVSRSIPLLLADSVLADPDLRYIAHIEYSITWPSGEGSVLLSAALNDYTFMQAEVTAGEAGVSYETLDLVNGVSAVVVNDRARPIIVRAGNYFRSASTTQAAGVLDVQVQLFGDARPESIVILDSSFFEASAIPIDPVSLTTSFSQPLETPDGRREVIVSYELTIAEGRSSDLTVVLDAPDYVTGAPVTRRFANFSGKESGEFLVSVPGDVSSLPMVLSVTSEFNSPSASMAIDLAEGTPSRQLARRVATLLGAALVVGVPLRWALRTRQA